jgi:TonB family protein
MKFCPTCERKYDEDIMQFCIKDGTPLIEEKQPSFKEMPSQASVEIDDPGEETVIVRKPKAPQIVPTQNPQKVDSGERIVISTQPEVKSKPYSPAPPPKKANIGMTVFMTILGTLAVIGGGLGVWWYLGKQTPASNVNSNRPTNVNTVSNANTTDYNANFGSNSTFNANLANTNVNTNSLYNTNLAVNTVTKTQTPTPTPKITPKPTVKPANVNANINANVKVNANTAVNTAANTVVNIKPANILPPPATPKPAQTQLPTPPKPTPKNVNVGNMTGRAVSLPKPAYPSTAKQSGANGQVIVQVTVDEEGNVLSASAVSGHPLLRRPAEAAARQAKFASNIGGMNSKATGVVVYNFQN